jgi:Sulfotransferase domain
MDNSKNKQSTLSAAAAASRPPPSWRRHVALFRLVAVWFLFAMMGIQPLANILKTAFTLTPGQAEEEISSNRLANHLDRQLYAPPAEYNQPATQETTNALDFTAGLYGASSIQAEDATFVSTSSTAGKTSGHEATINQHAYNNSSDSSSNNTTFLPVVVQTTDIASIPPHVVNHYVVNMNGRAHLGRGEKIIVVGQPKSGTSSVTSFFTKQDRKTKFRACHFACAIPVDANGYGTYNNKTVGRYMGVCMAEAKQKKLPLIKTCGDYDMIGQMDFSKPTHCHLPQVTMLQELHEEHPDATFILNLRNVHHWSSSVTRWGGMGTRLSKCEMGPKNAKAVSLRTWYQEHTTRIRLFVAQHPTHALVEIDVESPDTGPRLAAIFGLDEQGWVSFAMCCARSMHYRVE